MILLNIIEFRIKLTDTGIGTEFAGPVLSYLP